MPIADLLASLLNGAPLSIRAYDGSEVVDPNAKATVVVSSRDAVRRFLTAPNDLGLGRAFVTGDLDVEGDLLEAMRAVGTIQLRFDPKLLPELIRNTGVEGLKPLPHPPEEVVLSGRRHSRERDAAAIAHHYDVSNDFYALLLGPSQTYSCAVWADPTVGLDAAQAAKHELVCQKLGLQPGMRLLDVGCGWGSMAIHAAVHHGVDVVGVTVSSRQVEAAQQRVREAGLEGKVDIRFQDYRDITDGPFDAISSIGMFEHVGRKQLAEYFADLRGLLRPEGRLLNHGICRAARASDARSPYLPQRPRQRTFIDRYVFPDGELHEFGTVVSTIHRQDLEVRHTETLREHYSLTLSAWLRNLEANWERAVELVGVGRARVWRLYIAASAVGFELGRLQVHQVLAVRADSGQSGFPLRPAY